MNQIQSAYTNALLADAAYVKDIQTGNVEASSFESRVTLAQATYLAANFTVKASNQSPTGGFDAVVWEGKAGTEFARQLFVSMRGTQEGQDFLDDASLASRGILYDQIRDMINWWLKNTAAVTNTEVKQIKVHDAPGLLGAKSAASARSRGRFGLKSAPFAKRQHFKKKHRPALMDAA